MRRFRPVLRPVLGWALLTSGLASAGGASAQDPFGMLEAAGAMSSQAQYASSLHDRYSSSGSGYHDDDEAERRASSAQTYTPEQLARFEAIWAEERAQEEAAFDRWQEGFWQFFQSRDPAEPGQFCAAMYQNPQGVITLTGLDDSWDGALLMFTGTDVPKPRNFREITATLTQTGDSPASVRVFNYARDPRMYGMGTLVFAVPNMSAALDGITDEQEFAISVNGREVFRMTWKEGLSAVQGIRQCLRQG